MIGKQIEERVEFDEETRRKILKKTNFCCAACGQKLDMVRHTIDHIIPISRGGTNNIENLIGLCKMCNEYKNNLVFYPGDYYTYLMTTKPGAMKDIHNYVVDYLRKEVHKLDLHRYPFISPCCTAIAFINGIKPNAYIRQFLFDIMYMGSDLRRANSGKVNFLKDYAYYAVIKRSTQKLTTILRVDYNVGRYDPHHDGKGIAQLTIYDEWSACNAKILSPIMLNIAEVLATRYEELGIQLDQVCVASQDEKLPASMYDRCSVHGFGRYDRYIYLSVSMGILNDREELGEIPYLCIDVNGKDND